MKKMSKNYFQGKNESRFDYIKRMVQMRKDGLFKGSHADWIEIVFNIRHSEDVARREYYGCKMMINDLEEEIVESSPNEIQEAIMRSSIRLEKERVKINDEKRLLRRIKVQDARYEQAFDFAREYALIMKDSKPFLTSNNFNYKKNINGMYKGILCLSDWHYGIEIDNHINKFNPQIAKKRVSKIYESVVKDIDLFKLDELVIVNLNDLCSGIIHPTIRLENVKDVMEQVMEVSEMIAELIYNISQTGINIRYYSTLDNHSRVMPNKKESLDGENFTRLIDWHLKNRFEDVDNVEILDNELDDEYATFKVYNHNIIASHGHNDNPKNSVNTLSSLIHRDFDLHILGHRHSPALSESNERRIIENGTLSGTDAHAKKFRFSSTPSQNLIIASKENVSEYLRIINLK